jgi:signal transduction histidine kinase
MFEPPAADTEPRGAALDPGTGPVASAIAAPVLDGIRAVVEALPEAVLVADAAGSIRLTNEAADRLFSRRPVRSADDLLGRFEPDSDDGSGSDRRTVALRDQPNTWFALDQSGLGTAPRTATIFVLRDVTSTPDLRPQREAFLGVLSHELRTPLTTIYAGSSVLARRPSLSPPATRTLALDISSEAARLYELIENLLVIARLERRVLHPIDERVDLERVVEGAVRALDERFLSAEISTTGIGNAPPVRGDATYVELACRNLILAALRAAPDEATAVLVAVDIDRDRSEVTVRVLDRGPALRPGEAGRVFDLPTTAEPGRLSGAGVGPYVARQAIEAMGGRTWAHNRPGGGVETGFALRIAAGDQPS